MSQAPSMPMFWDAYLADTTHLTTEEHGAYLLLLAAMWRRNGSVPDDDRDIARIVGLTKGKWLKVKARLAEFLTVENGEISQKKLQKTWEKTQEIASKNRSNGAKGGRPKTNKNNRLTKPNGSVSDNPNKTLHIQSNNNPPISPKGDLLTGLDVSEQSAPDSEMQAIDEGWEDFKAIWPKGHSRRDISKNCQKKYVAACLGKNGNATGKVSPTSLNRAARAYIAEEMGNQAGRYIKGTAAWLNGAKWEPYLSAEAHPQPSDRLSRYQKIEQQYAHLHVVGAH